MRFESEESFRKWLVAGLRQRLGQSATVLGSKNVTDDVICIDPRSGPRALFIEVKYAKESSGRIGVGDGDGGGYQTEILTKGPAYFEANTRWLIAVDDGWAVLVDNESVREHAVGGEFCEGKQNNIRDSVFENDLCFPIGESVERVAWWVETVA